MAKEKESSIYGWAFVAGQKIIERLETLYGKDRAGKRMESLLLTLRSELIPDRFRRSIIDSLIEVSPEVGIPEEIKVEMKWNIDEFYRYSTAVLAGFFDALNKWKEKKEKEGEKHAQ
uniref:CRISPR type III-B/RAMP module-associated protein Cmr5 n=1 Tax=candidate division WOR-3 bacterium TaxID=2052148 RepID=A0A7C2K3J9_UNCW3